MVKLAREVASELGGYPLKKTVLFAAATAAAALIAMPAAAAVYFEGEAGATLGGKSSVTATTPEDGTVSGDIDLNTGYLIGGSVGTHLNPNVRVEGEMAYTSNDMSDIDINLHQISLMANVFYDFTPAKKVSPYVGAGVGFGRSFVEVDKETANDTGMAWQLRAGVNIHTASGPTWNIGYRYLNQADFNKAEGDYALKFDAHVHALTIGVQFGG